MIKIAGNLYSFFRAASPQRSAQDTARERASQNIVILNFSFIVFFCFFFVCLFVCLFVVFGNLFHSILLYRISIAWLQ